MLKRHSHLIEGLIWLVFVTLAFVYTFDFDDPLPVYEWGPAHWPRVILFGMFVATCWLLFYEARNRRGTNDRNKGHDRDVLTLPTQVRMVSIFAIPVIYAFLIHKMGFLLITPIFLFTYMWIVGVRKLRTLIIMTVSIYAVLVLVFVKLIFTYLPPGAGVFNTINGYFLRILQ